MDTALSEVVFCKNEIDSKDGLEEDNQFGIILGKG